jgi:3-isopropylmalate dehydrogenase
MPSRTLVSVPTKSLAQCLPDWQQRSDRSPRVLGVVHGEGIGPEVVEAALVVLDALMRRSGLHLEVRIAGASGGHPVKEYVEFCRSIFAAGGTVLCGPMGGRFVYDLRAAFDLYCKLVPLHPSPALADVSIVRPERLTAVDVVIVRENVGGIYFGESGRCAEGRIAYQHVSYSADQVVRIIEAAARLARLRRGRLSVVVKTGGVPEVSALWSEQAAAVASAHAVDLEIIEADNASFQLVADPRRFDVVVAPNLFGDLLADAATVLLGSRGMSYSANFGAEGRAVYQTGHGAAHDLAGSDRANPVAQILSVAMLLRESFGLARQAAQIETAVENVLAAGVRTLDIAGRDSRVVGTRELAECIARELASSGDTETEVA